MSKAYAKQKKYNKALEEINKSLKIYPDSKWAIYLHNNYSKELK